MQRSFTFLVAIVCLIAYAQPHAAQARNLKYINHQVDPNKISQGEIYILQMALTFGNAYKGQINGVWSPETKKALHHYVAKKYKSKPPKWKDAVRLVEFYRSVHRKLKWSRYRTSNYAFSFLYPSKVMDTYRHKKLGYLGFRTSNKDLDISLINMKKGSDTSSMRRFHKRNTELSKKPGHSLIQNKISENSLISEVKGTHGQVYAHSMKKKDGNWSTLYIRSKNSHLKTYEVIRNTVTTRDNIPKGMPPNGYLTDLVALSRIAKVKNIGSNARIIRTKQPNGKQKKRYSTGTGFYIDKNGTILTNKHVVTNCKEITVNGKKLIKRAESGLYDLAVLKHEKPYKPKRIATFSPNIPGLNADVTVGGYPYTGLLGGFNITRGVISGRSGIKGNKNNWQISAALQSGNSGGAVVNKYGHVVGVAVSKLNAVRVAKKVGDLPQNVNFAVKGATARKFLAENKISFTAGSNKTQPSPETLAIKMDQYSVLIRCELKPGSNIKGVRYYKTTPGYHPFFKPRKKYKYKNQKSLEDEAFGK